MLLFAWRHRAARVIQAWRAHSRDLLLLPWAAHYTRVRRAALRGWWQCVWLLQHARPLAHYNHRTLRLAFEELRQVRVYGNHFSRFPHVSLHVSLHAAAFPLTPWDHGAALQHVYDSHPLHVSPWRHNVTSLHFTRWRRCAPSSPIGSTDFNSTFH